MIIYVENLGEPGFVFDAMVTRIRNHLKEFADRGLKVVAGIPGDDQTGDWVLFNLRKYDFEDKWNLEIITANDKSTPRDLGSSFVLLTAFDITDNYYTRT